MYNQEKKRTTKNDAAPKEAGNTHQVRLYMYQ